MKAMCLRFSPEFCKQRVNCRLCCHVCAAATPRAAGLVSFLTDVNKHSIYKRESFTEKALEFTAVEVAPGVVPCLAGRSFPETVRRPTVSQGARWWDCHCSLFGRKCEPRAFVRECTGLLAHPLSLLEKPFFDIHPSVCSIFFIDSVLIQSWCACCPTPLYHKMMIGTSVPLVPREVCL